MLGQWPHLSLLLGLGAGAKEQQAIMKLGIKTSWLKNRQDGKKKLEENIY